MIHRTAAWHRFNRFRVKPGAGALVMLAVTQAASAQEPCGEGKRLALAMWTLGGTQRDGNASPLRYGGIGPFAHLSYQSRGGRSCVGLGMGGASATLHSAITARNLPRQELKRGWLEGQYLRQVGAGESATRLYVGAHLGASLNLTAHNYSDPNRGGVRYAFLAMSLSPVAAVERRVGGRGALTAVLGLPVVSLVGRTHSGDIRLIPRGGLPIRLETVASLRGFDAGFRYVAGIGKPVSVVFGYELTVLDYEDAEDFRAASHRFSLGLAVRVGGRR